MKRGATLISTLVGIGFLAVTLAGLVQLYSLASVAVSVAESRSLALMAAETEIETAQTEGYLGLPPIGQYPVDDAALAPLPDASGTITVARGPQPRSRTVRVEITWRQRPGRQLSTVCLCRIIAAGGMSG